MTLHYLLSISGSIEHLETFIILYFLLFFLVDYLRFKKKNSDARGKDAQSILLLNLLVNLRKMEIDTRF